MFIHTLYSLGTTPYKTIVQLLDIHFLCLSRSLKVIFTIELFSSHGWGIPHPQGGEVSLVRPI